MFCLPDFVSLTKVPHFNAFFLLESKHSNDAFLLFIPVLGMLSLNIFNGFH